MATPVRKDVLTMDFSQNGGAWVRVAAKVGIDVGGMDWSQNGGSWWGVKVSSVPKGPLAPLMIIGRR